MEFFTTRIEEPDPTAHLSLKDPRHACCQADLEFGCPVFSAEDLLECRALARIYAGDYDGALSDLSRCRTDLADDSGFNTLLCHMLVVVSDFR